MPSRASQQIGGTRANLEPPKTSVAERASAPQATAMISPPTGTKPRSTFEPASMPRFESRPASNALPHLKPVMELATLASLQEKTNAVRVDQKILEYVVSIANATRRSPDLRLGLSPRGALALTQTARATALIDGRDYVVPEDVLDNIMPVVAHRLIVRGGLEQSDGREAEAILDAIIQSVEAPT